MSRAPIESRFDLSGLIPALLIAAAVSACASQGLARPRDASGEACYSDDFRSLGGRDVFDRSNTSPETLANIADQCLERSTHRELTSTWLDYANYYSGKALRARGDKLIAARRQQEADVIWPQAKRVLQLVVLAPADASPINTPARVRAGLMRYEARVELAVVETRLNHQSEALQLATEAIEYFKRPVPLPANSPELRELSARVAADRIDASYALAKAQLLSPAGLDSAIVALRDAFTGETANTHRLAGDARKELYDLATKRGSELLDRGGSDLGTAQIAFRAALDAAVAANAYRPTTDWAGKIADADINLGAVSLKIAGRAGPDQAAGGCAPGNTDQLNVSQAVALFDDAFRQPVDVAHKAKALRWKGCAQQVAGISATESFEKALSFDPGSAETQIAYARATAQAARTATAGAGDWWEKSRGAYREAVRLMNRTPKRPDADIANARVESANSALEYVNAIPNTRDAQAIVREATQALKEARGTDAINAEAYLRLGTIEIGDGPYANQRNWSDAYDHLKIARENALTRQDVRYAAQYQLSRLGTQQIYEARRRRGGMSRSDQERIGRAAFKEGAEAATHADNSSALEYYRQACDARILANDTDARDDQFCLFSDSRIRASTTFDPATGSAEAWLRQGMYQLSRGSNARKPAVRSDAWDAAIIAFDHGVDALGAQEFGADAPPYSARDLLLGKLLTGKAIVLNCNHLEQTGKAVTDRIPTGLYNSVLEETYKQDYDLNRCQPR